MAVGGQVMEPSRVPRRDQGGAREGVGCLGGCRRRSGSRPTRKRQWRAATPRPATRRACSHARRRQASTLTFHPLPARQPSGWVAADIGHTRKAKCKGRWRLRGAALSLASRKLWNRLCAAGGECVVRRGRAPTPVGRNHFFCVVDPTCRRKSPPSWRRPPCRNHPIGRALVQKGKEEVVGMLNCARRTWRDTASDESELAEGERGRDRRFFL